MQCPVKQNQKTKPKKIKKPEKVSGGAEKKGALSSPVFKNFKAGALVQSLLDNPPPSIAVALSGGPDSMALLYLLSQLAVCPVHAITIDHGLRKNSAAEAEQVARWVKDWPNVHHHILKWTGKKPEANIMERARDARYALLEKWCRKKSVGQLWLGHNRTDQAETFLFRLAKGSGLDGLGGIQACSFYQDTNLALMRPLLDVSKDDLLTFCRTHKIPHVKDPSNENPKFARIRLRQALPVLEAEGLSEKRLAVTAQRLSRARAALDYYTAQLFDHSVTLAKNRASIKLTALTGAPEEIRTRVIRRVLAELSGVGHGPRLETLEDRLSTFFAAGGAAKRFTLGGFLFSQDVKKDIFLIMREL